MDASSEESLPMSIVSTEDNESDDEPYDGPDGINISHGEIIGLIEEYRRILEDIICAERLPTAAELKAMKAEASQKCSFLSFVSMDTEAMMMSPKKVGSHLYITMTVLLSNLSENVVESVAYTRDFRFWTTFEQRWTRFKAQIDAIHEVSDFIHREFCQVLVAAGETRYIEARPCAYGMLRNNMFYNLEDHIPREVAGIHRRFLAEGTISDIERRFVDAVVDCYKTIGVIDEDLEQDASDSLIQMLLGVQPWPWEVSC